MSLLDRLMDEDHVVRVWKLRSENIVCACIDSEHYGSGPTIDTALESACKSMVAAN